LKQNDSPVVKLQMKKVDRKSDVQNTQQSSEMDRHVFVKLQIKLFFHG